LTGGTGCIADRTEHSSGLARALQGMRICRTKTWRRQRSSAAPQGIQHGDRTRATESHRSRCVCHARWQSPSDAAMMLYRHRPRSRSGSCGPRPVSVLRDLHAASGDRGGHTAMPHRPFRCNWPDATALGCSMRLCVTPAAPMLMVHLPAGEIWCATDAQVYPGRRAQRQFRHVAAMRLDRLRQ
jgi:hypothetical protein